MIPSRFLTVALSLLVVAAEPSEECSNPGSVSSSSMMQQQQSMRKALQVTSTGAERGAASDARFLMQASFGPTRASLAELSQMTYAQWVAKQMQLPAESHREYYRQRVNPTFDSSPQQTAKVDTPCTKGSRWYRFAFTHKDVGDSIFVNGTDAILVGGVFRTGIKPRPLASSWVGLAGFRGHICYVREGLGEDVEVAEDVSCKKGRKYMPNPAIWRVPGSIPEVSVAYAPVKPGVVVLAESVRSCPFDQPGGGGPVFVQSQGAIYRYDPRVRLAYNVPASPTGDIRSCVMPSPVNEQSCKVWRIPNSSSTIPGLTVEVKSMSRRRRGKYVSQIDGPTVGLLVDEEVYHPATYSGWPGFPLAGYFAARWTGSLLIKAGGSYKFWLTTDDGSELHIDSQQVVDNGGDHTMREKSGSAKLTAGSHDIAINYFQSSSAAGIIFEWQGPDSGEQREVVPSSALSTLSQGQVRGGCPVSCGSPGEVASEPAAGHHFSMYRTADSSSVDNDYDSRYANRMSSRLSKSTVWTMKAIEAQDQLRQRVAWALSQIFVVSTQGIGDDNFSEMWIAYYDIFVRHAFGNFRDLMQEVTYSPMMGKYLTHSYSTSYDYNGHFPNENYAREILQLFTIGLDALNKDGTPKLDASGQEIATYTNEQIMSLARVFTGFVNKPVRSNIEYFSSSTNYIDPMDLNPLRHDVYPKPDLAGGFLGDGYPPCSDPAPAESFLAKGAKYRYSLALHPSDVLVLDAQSVLLKALCGQGASCGTAYSVTLPAALPCSGRECGAGPVRFVKAGDAIYEHLPPPCVHSFFHGATAKETAANEPPVAQPGYCKHSDGSRSRSVKLDSLDGDGAERQAECLAKCRKAGGVGCQLIWSRGSRGCYVHLSTKMPLVGSGSRDQLCWYFNESGLHGHSYALAKMGAQGCPAGTEIASIAECEQAQRSMGLSWSYTGLYYRSSDKVPKGCISYPGRLYWSTQAEAHGHRSLTPVCRAFITVDAEGAYVPVNVHSKFGVPWLDGAPAPGTHPVTARSQRVFGALPTSKAEAKARLSTGAHPPTGACDVCEGEVKAYYGKQGLASAETVFEVDGRYYKNAESVLVFADGRRAFRNPPVFLRSTSDAGAEAAAAAEVEAALDHLFHHGNTPVFFAKRMIQRFVTSNPSKSHVAAAADAFTTGAYDGVTYSGRYGDIAATVAAVLLHPDARTLKSDVAETIDGALREPMLKVMHLMRSMEYRDADKSQVVFQHLHEVIGQFPYNAPSVFNYYLADYELPMPKLRQPEPEMEPEPEPEPESKTVYGPEFQIFTPPYMVGYLNGMSSLIKSGVSDRCDSGKSLGTYVSVPEDGQWRQVCPQGSLTWPGAGTPNQTLHELDVLLTGGRLTPVAKEVVRRAYEEAPPGRELERAQQATVMTAEFNTLGAPLPKPGVRPPSAGEGAKARQPYRAFIVLFLNGGADTWNMVVPQDCGLYQEYRDIRTDLALDTNELLSITTSGQKCQKFGLHAAFRFLKGLYDAGEAAIVSNVGNLVEPMTKELWRSGGARRCINLFSHSDQQAGAQTLKCQELGTSAKGAGGRVADALAGDGLRTTSFSLAGSAIWPKGVTTRREIVDERGSKTFHEYEQWMDAISNITAQRHGNVYAEAYADAFLNNVESSQNLGRVLEGVQLLTTYPQDSRLQRELSTVAKLIAAREGRQAERDFFFVSTGGWDMHSNMKMNLNTRFGMIDDALRGFVAEMQAQKVWDSVVLATESEFARTLDSNGGGSDHAWAGQHFVISGAIKGQRIFNKFPATFKAGNDRDLGRGRLIPEYPWESMLVPVAEWMGLQAKDSARAFPNLASFNTSHIIPRKELFKN